MTNCSFQPRNRIFVKGYRFFSFAKNMGKNIDKNISKSLNSKYCQNFLIMLKNLQQSAADAFKTSSNRVIQKQKKHKQPVI